MNKVEKVKVLSELFDLINMYYVARDLPSEENDFFMEVEKCCILLDLDYTELKNVFGLNCAL
ncbi:MULTISPECIES: hypothetical protein [unclassified Paenibacillus]|uniref:hypothetical protein n=1 Tax=unclassified Paenibacillus TaxID=185978 RepID=UPI001AE652F3|nr:MULTISPECIES: hypothetical protein [unclassified Paenibacillus]MBP1154487.1 hypothetical protein [Paenibacillus sp. PvP091]MBP1170129.1 hypothetical protein [Paenibacillus sp. PvR098]MBP2441157.1 hypothetical protein [Paenibacillus sp. PvP052]